jgi:hypothetical protein
MNAAEALAEARRAHAEQLARRAEVLSLQVAVDELAAQLAAHLKWLQENPDAIWDWLSDCNAEPVG